MTGAYINIPKKAQNSTIPNEALTKNSWATADTKNTTMLAFHLGYPLFNKGKYKWPRIIRMKYELTNGERAGSKVSNIHLNSYSSTNPNKIVDPRILRFPLQCCILIGTPCRKKEPTNKY